MEQCIGLELFHGHGKRQPAVEGESLSGVAVPLDVETVAANPIEADKGGVELFTDIFREAGTVSLNEPMLGAVPFANNVHGIVEFSGPYGRREPSSRKCVRLAQSSRPHLIALVVSEARGCLPLYSASHVPG